MTSKKWYALVAVLVIGGTLLAACAQPAPETVVVTKIVEQAGEKVVEEVVITATPPPPPKEMRPNVLHLNFGPGDVPTLDPALSTDTSSVQVVDEITVGLTRLNEVTLELEPGMAESWEASEDGLTYVFHLREGIPWVRWNGTEVEEVKDDEGNVRYVMQSRNRFRLRLRAWLRPRGLQRVARSRGLCRHERRGEAGSN